MRSDFFLWARTFGVNDDTIPTTKRATAVTAVARFVAKLWVLCRVAQARLDSVEVRPGEVPAEVEQFDALSASTMVHLGRRTDRSDHTLRLFAGAPADHGAKDARPDVPRLRPTI